MTTLTPKSDLPEASASSPAFVVAVNEDFSVLGYLCTGRAFESRHGALRFATEQEAQSAALAFEADCDLSSLYCTIRQAVRG